MDKLNQLLIDNNYYLDVNTHIHQFIIKNKHLNSIINTNITKIKIFNSTFPNR